MLDSVALKCEGLNHEPENRLEYNHHIRRRKREGCYRGIQAGTPDMQVIARYWIQQRQDASLPRGC